MPPKPSTTTTTTPPPNPHFKPGTLVEISSDDPGFRGSWFTGTIIRRPSTKTPTKILVEYTHLFDDESGSKPLRELLETHQLRPIAPREGKRVFKFGEEVDAYQNDGWWEGTITKELENGKFKVYFRRSREQIVFGPQDLRLHREWIHEKWTPPLEEEEEEDEVCFSNPIVRIKLMNLLGFLYIGGFLLFLGRWLYDYAWSVRFQF